MNIKIICVGSMKEKYLRDMLAEYDKRLSRFIKIIIKELPDEKIKDNAGEKERLAVLEREGKSIIKNINAKDFVVALAIEGKMLKSEDFAALISEKMMTGENICFIIGGSLGLSDEVKNRASMLLSFSKMTFLHTISRALLLEQIYRAFKIISGETYHK